MTLFKHKFWTQEERNRLARQEAIVLADGVLPRLVNAELYPLFPHRMEESVKGERRKAGHKEAVQRQLFKIQAQPTNVLAEEPLNSEWGSEFLENILSHLRELETRNNPYTC